MSTMRVRLFGGYDHGCTVEVQGGTHIVGTPVSWHHPREYQCSVYKLVQGYGGALVGICTGTKYMGRS